jgi:hypothetical protein
VFSAIDRADASVRVGPANPVRQTNDGGRLAAARQAQLLVKIDFCRSNIPECLDANYRIKGDEGRYRYCRLMLVVWTLGQS